MTGLPDRAVLEIQLTDANDQQRTCVFEFREDLERSTSTTHQYLLGNRGQYLREAVDLGSDVLGVDLPEANNRRGYHVDGGAGVVQITLTATGGDRDVRWGDGSSDPNDPNDVTKYDAAGCGPQAQMDVLDWVSSQAKTDSANAARLYTGQFSDGTYAGTPGAFGKPRAIAIRELATSNAPDDPNAFTITFEGIWTALFPTAALDEVQGAIDELAENIPE